MNLTEKEMGTTLVLSLFILGERLVRSFYIMNQKNRLMLTLSIPTLAMALSFAMEPLLSCLHVVSFSMSWAICRMFGLFVEEESSTQITRGWAGDNSTTDIANTMILLGIWMFIDVIQFSVIKIGI